MDVVVGGAGSESSLCAVVLTCEIAVILSAGTEHCLHGVCTGSAALQLD